MLLAQEECSVAEHPRLLLKAGEETGIARMIERDEAMRRVHDGIVSECDRMLETPPLQRVMEGKRLLHTSREALRRIFWLSYSYRMTGMESYAARARDEMLAVCRFSDWNPSHFLDVGEMVMAVAIGYDWLYDYLSADERRAACEAIVSKGFVPADNEDYAGFYNLANNWNQVCCSGLLYGALATYEEHPEMADELIDLYVKSVPFALACYAPDGGYPEGFNYWGYGTSFQVMMIAALESALGTDYGLCSSEGFLETSSFVQFMTAPSGMCFNFSDSPSAAPCNPMMFWFAAKTGDMSRILIERRNIERLPEGFMGDVSTLFTEHRLLPALLIFCSSMDMDCLQEPQEHFAEFKGRTPLFIYREGWSSTEDTYLGIKGGSPMTSHAHMDAGSFVYEHDGVRWSMDLGMQDYHSLESRGVDLWNQEQEGQRWDVFRIGNEAHSTLTLNGRHHRVKSFVPIVETWQENGRKGALLDMTEAFTEDAERVSRAVWLDRRNHLHVQDTIVASPEGTQVQWTMTTPAKAEIAGSSSIRLEKDGRRMTLSISSDTPFRLHILPDDPPNDYDAPNPGTCRIGFTATIPPSGTAAFCATLE